MEAIMESMEKSAEDRVLFDLHRLETRSCYIVSLSVTGAPRLYDCVLKLNGVIFTFKGMQVRTLTFSECGDTGRMLLKVCTDKDDDKVPLEKKDVLTLHRVRDAQVIIQCPEWIDWEKLLPKGEEPYLTMKAYVLEDGEYKLTETTFPRNA